MISYQLAVNQFPGQCRLKYVIILFHAFVFCRHPVYGRAPGLLLGGKHVWLGGWLYAVWPGGELGLGPSRAGAEQLPKSLEAGRAPTPDELPAQWGHVFVLLLCGHDKARAFLRLYS